jgi:hypothetical protein
MKPKQRIAAKATESVSSTNSAVRRQPTHGEISARAREIWVKRGHPHGQDTAIWLQAERSLLAGAIGAGLSDEADADTRQMLGEPSGTIEDRLSAFGETAGGRSATSL